VRRSLLAGFSFLAAGLAAGSVAGSRGFDRAYEPELLCPTCHDDMDLDSQERGLAPHSTDFRGTWHAWLSFQPQSYAQLLAVSMGLSPEGWAPSLAPPNSSGLSCLDCHLQRTQAEIPCELCHLPDQEDWDHTELIVSPHRCLACHFDQAPMGSHKPEACRDCHLEVVGNKRKKAKMVVMDRLRGGPDPEREQPVKASDDLRLPEPSPAEPTPSSGPQGGTP